MQENSEYSVFSLQTMGFYCIFVGLFRKLGIFAKSNPKVGQNVYKFNRIFRKIGKFGAKCLIITRSSYILLGNPEKSGNSSQMSANVQSNFPKTREIRSKIPNNYYVQLHFVAINPKNREIRDKMSNILAKWLHYLWFFPNIRDILIKLLHLLGDFSENSGNSYRNTYICQCKSQKLLALATINAYNAYNVYNAYKML